MAEPLPDPRPVPSGPTAGAAILAQRRAIRWFSLANLHLLQALIFFVALGCVSSDPVGLAFASVIVAWVHCLAFLRSNPRMAGLELIALILIAYYWPGESRYAVLWVAAGALAGGASALLAVRGAREEDFYFLPPAAGLASYAFLVWLADACRFAEPAGALRDWLHSERIDIPRLLSQTPNWQEVQSQISPFVGDRIVGILMVFSAAVWVFGLWILARSARRWSGRLDPRRASLILFRIEQHYLFLLICCLVLWIVGILAGSEQLALVAAAPVLAVFSVACAIEGLAVVLFRMAVWRTSVSPLVWRLSMIGFVVGCVVLMLYAAVALALLGLSDIWFDFRRVRAVEERLGTAP